MALRNVDLALPAGEVHCLVGENGSGKSTLIKIIAGVLRPQPEGRIVIEGREYLHLNPVQSTGCGIQVIYQDLSLFSNRTVAENIAVGRHLGPPQVVTWRTIEATAEAAIARIGASPDPFARVEDLSIASRQLVAISRAMAADARLVIVDEPTSSLTRHEVDALIRLVADLKRSGISAPDFSRARTVLSVERLTRTGQYENVSLDIHAGEIVGLIGLLGSDRTEFALSLFGMNPPTSGEIRLNGKVLALKTNSQAIAEGIAYVSEDRLTLGLVFEQPIASNILVTVLDKVTNRFGWCRKRTVNALHENGSRIWQSRRRIRTTRSKAELQAVVDA